MSTKNEIFDYVMESPENINPSILRSLLNDLEEAPMPDNNVTFHIVATNYDDNGYYTASLAEEWNEVEEAFLSGKNISIEVYYDSQTIILKCTGAGYKPRSGSEPAELGSVCFSSYVYPLFGDWEERIYCIIYSGGDVQLVNGLYFKN